MMFASFTNAVRATLLLSVALGALANPISSLDARDVFVPPVTDPKAGTVWAANSKQTVSWDVSSAPANITNGIGSIRLRKGGLGTPVVLADGFDVRLGNIDVDVPFLVQGTDYQIVFFGDSGDNSVEFTITSSVKA